MDFPNNTEKLLLDAAAIQATHGLQAAAHREALGADLIERERQLRYSEESYRELVDMARMSSLGALTASIAHEVNQPLAGIMTNASTGLRMLSADPPNISGALETARRTIRDAHRASDVIGRLRRVVDSGIGIDPGRADKLFEPFYTTKAAGMGIGLSISRSIIERHGGHLWAEPSDPHGAAFSFAVPQYPPISRT